MSAEANPCEEYLRQFELLAARAEMGEAVGRDRLALVREIQARAHSLHPAPHARKFLAAIATRIERLGDATGGLRSDFLCKSAVMLGRTYEADPST